MGRGAALGLSLMLMAGGCGNVKYEDTQKGELNGSLFVMWVGEGDDFYGDGRFLFVPDPNDPLYFRSKKDGLKVQPGMLYTDGGSIPRPVQMFKGFSPWGYGPAYIIHDWLFVLRHCETDGTPKPGQENLKGISFERSAELLGETIRTLVETGRVDSDDVAPAVITGTVSGPISRAAWSRKGACAGHAVAKADRERAEAAIPGSSARMRKALPSGVKPALIVGKISY